MSIKTGILNPSFENIISLSPAFWFGFPGIVNDLNNLSKKSICNLSVGTNEGDIFGDQVKNIFPKEWDLDFSNNNDFYVSGVKKLKRNLSRITLKQISFSKKRASTTKHTGIQFFVNF